MDETRHVPPKYQTQKFIIKYAKNIVKLAVMNNSQSRQCRTGLISFSL